MKYRSKPAEVEAFHYGPHFRPGLVKELAEFIAGEPLDSDTDILEHVQPNAPWDPSDPQYAVVRVRAGADGAQGWVPVPLGHWVVRKVGDRSDHWPVDPKYFEEKYETATEQE